MTPELYSIIEEYNLAPLAIQQQVFYGETSKFAEKIIIAFEIEPEKAVILENEIILTLLGIQPHRGLAERIVEGLAIDIETSSIIVELINLQIFEPLLESLQNLKQDVRTTIITETPYQPEYFQVADPAPTPSITTDAILKFNAARAQLLAETSAPEMRTMASDMARSSEQTDYEPMTTVDEPTYTSQQPEVRTPLSGLPAYTNAHTPTAAPTPAIHEPARWS